MLIVYNAEDCKRLMEKYCPIGHPERQKYLNMTPNDRYYNLKSREFWDSVEWFFDEETQHYWSPQLIFGKPQKRKKGRPRKVKEVEVATI